MPGGVHGVGRRKQRPLLQPVDQHVQRIFVKVQRGSCRGSSGYTWVSPITSMVLCEAHTTHNSGIKQHNLYQASTAYSTSVCFMCTSCIATMHSPQDQATLSVHNTDVWIRPGLSRACSACERGREECTGPGEHGTT
eukprot:m.1038102 g.1038102  ORF g.1038102 m.1038102 type:complete len:137 (-) comp24148_c0_seq2:2347-2757(-)